MNSFLKEMVQIWGEFKIPLSFFTVFLVASIVGLYFVFQAEKTEKDKLSAFCLANPQSSYQGCVEYRVYGHALNHGGGAVPIPILMPMRLK